MIARATPSLRIARFFVEGFRTFRERTEIPLADEGGPADEIATFHGPNGSGKSNALAALEVFFRGMHACLALKPLSRGQQPQEDRGFILPWDWENATGFRPDRRSWPPGVFAPQVMEAHFEDPRFPPLRLVQIRQGGGILLRLENGKEPFLEGAYQKIIDPVWDLLGHVVEEPLGPRSQPFFRLNARRTSFQAPGAKGTDIPSSTPMSPRLADTLYELRNSLDPEDTTRWYAFEALIGRFVTLAGREINMVRDPRAEGAEMRFEIRGKQVLRLSELSSGEQQIVALCAAVLTSRAAIVAIEEPEISLHPDYQALLREVLAEQVKNGIVDQVILESHSPIFDSSPKVVHFSRTEDEIPVTRVSRVPAVEVDPAVREAAKAAGARRHWVSRDGYTRLPPEMCARMGLDQAGGHVWFLPDDSGPAWRAWKEEDLDAVFGERTGAPAWLAGLPPAGPAA